MMRKVKVKRPKNSSTLERMKVPKLELPTAQFGASIIGGTSQPDPGNFRSSKKTESIERAKAAQEAKDQGIGKTIGLGAAGFLTGALSSIPIIGGAFEGLNEKVQDKDKTGAAGIASGIGKIAGGIPTTVFSGGTMGTGDIAEGVGDVMGGSSEIAYNKGNDKKSERLGKAEQAFDTIAPIADMASGLAGGIKGAEGAEGMFKGPEGIKGGMKSLLGGTSSTEGRMKGVMKGFDTLDSFDTFDMNTTSEVNSLPFGKFGTKLPLEMELMPEGGKMVDGYLHEEGGVITKHRGKAVAEIEGGEGITKDGIVFSDTTINPETGKPFSKDAKKLIKSKDNSKEGETTRRLAEEELYIKQEKAKEMQGLVNRGEDMKKYKKGGSLKAIPSDNKGLPQLPESVRNQMGYMKSGGGLYANIHAKRERIRKGSGERMRKPGTKGAPTDKAFERAKETAKKTAMYGKKLNLPKMQGGDKVFSDAFSENMAYNTRRMGTLDKLAKKDNMAPFLTGDGTLNYDSEAAIPKKDIFSTTETGVTGRPMLKTMGERFFRNADGSLNYNNKKLRGGEKKDGEEGEDGKGNLTPGDITQLAGNAVAPLANLAAMRSIRENTVDLGRDRSIIEEKKVSTADLRRAARQEAAATRAGLTQLGSDAMKSAVAAGATKAIQDAELEAKRLDIQLARSKDQLDMQRSQFNVGQADKEAIDKQTRKDLATTTGLTAAEQTGKALVDLGLTKNQGLTNTAQLKVLKEAFPDFTITQDNMKSFIRDLSTGKEERILKYKTQ